MGRAKYGKRRRLRPKSRSYTGNTIAIISTTPNTAAATPSLCLIRSPQAFELDGRHAPDARVRFDVLVHDRARFDDGAGTDFDSRQHDGTGAQPGTVADAHRACDDLAGAVLGEI